MTPMAEPLPRRPIATERNPSFWQSGEPAPPTTTSASHSTSVPSLHAKTFLGSSKSFTSTSNRKCTPSNSAFLNKSSCNSPMPIWQKSLSPPKVPPGGSKIFAPHWIMSCLPHSQRWRRLIRVMASAAGLLSKTVTSACRSPNSNAARRPTGPAPTTTVFLWVSGAATYSGRNARASSNFHTVSARHGSCAPHTRWMRWYGNSPRKGAPLPPAAPAPTHLLIMPL
mmetsp:Transcript_48486/g.130066  ORF Transcript_48486/g.130066 Transcript_48486/m.130066 type:complete len:225 (+) Transcript_48486:759-1433(+)